MTTPGDLASTDPSVQAPADLPEEGCGEVVRELPDTPPIVNTSGSSDNRRTHTGQFHDANLLRRRLCAIVVAEGATPPAGRTSGGLAAGTPSTAENVPRAASDRLPNAEDGHGYGDPPLRLIVSLPLPRPSQVAWLLKALVVLVLVPVLLSAAYGRGMATGRQEVVADLNVTRSALAKERQCRIQAEQTLRRLYHFPEFQPDPPLPGLQHSNHNRRCRKAGGPGGYVSAVAKEGFAAGQQQFTVHIIHSGNFVHVGVSTAHSPRTGDLYSYGIYLNANGTVFSVNKFQQQYSTTPFSDGSHVTVKLDFANGTASFEVDGRDLGALELPLPKGPLYPTVLLNNVSDEAEFVPYLVA
eukprot:EG_transcript_10344